MSENEIITEIRKKLNVVAPDARVLLFGSRARGTASTNSDWDIMVILRKDKIESKDYDEIAYPLFELGWDFDQNFSIKLYTTSDWNNRSYTLFYKNVEKEGIVI